MGSNTAPCPPFLKKKNIVSSKGWIKVLGCAKQALCRLTHSPSANQIPLFSSLMHACRGPFNHLNLAARFFFLTYVMKPVNPHGYFSAGDETRGLTHARHAQLHPSSPSYQVWNLSSGSFSYGTLLQPFLLRSSIVCLRADLSLCSREDRDRK